MTRLRHLLADALWARRTLRRAVTGLLAGLADAQPWDGFEPDPEPTSEYSQEKGMRR